MEIFEYRGRATTGGQWVYGNLIVTENLAAIRGKDVNGQQGEFPIAPITVGLRTGIKDKNGRDIYDGDIVDVTINGTAPFRHLVSYIEPYGCFGFQEDGPSGPIYRPLCDMLMPAHADDKIEIEVVGNAYESPELLNALSPLLLA